MEIVCPIPEEVYTAVDELPGARLYHKKPWHDLLSETLGWQVKAWVGRGEGRAVDFYLPFVEKRGLGLKRNRIALPLSHHVPPLGALPEDPAAVLGEAFIHASLPARAGVAADETRSVTILDLAATADEAALAKGVRSAVMRKVKKAKKDGYAVRRASADALVDAFTTMQAETRRRQGSPTFPNAFFPAMARLLGEGFHLHTVLTPGGEPVAGVIFIDDGETAIYGYGASLDRRELWRDGVNQLAMWDAITAAHQRGAKQVDFGSTPKLLADLTHYKEKWGGVTEDLPYARIGSSAAAQPERDSPLIRAASAVMKRLPAPLFRAVSPVLLKLAA